MDRIRVCVSTIARASGTRGAMENANKINKRKGAKGAKLKVAFQRVSGVCGERMAGESAKKRNWQDEQKDNVQKSSHIYMKRVPLLTDF